jgi:hypothetical protein
MSHSNPGKESIYNSGDDDTWVSELQLDERYNNESSFQWKQVTYDNKTAERKSMRKRNKWGARADHVKRLARRAMEEVMEDTEGMGGTVTNAT